MVIIRVDKQPTDEDETRAWEVKSPPTSPTSPPVVYGQQDPTVLRGDLSEYCMTCGVCACEFWSDKYSNECVLIEVVLIEGVLIEGVLIEFSSKF